LIEPVPPLAWHEWANQSLPPARPRLVGSERGATDIRDVSVSVTVSILLIAVASRRAT
jgi:hypothetical protein